MAWIMDLGAASVTRRAPQVLPYDMTIKDDKLRNYTPYPEEPTWRGYPVPREHVPKILYTESKAKKNPDLFDATSHYYVCSKRGREFLEKTQMVIVFLWKRQSSTIKRASLSIRHSSGSKSCTGWIR